MRLWLWALCADVVVDLGLLSGRVNACVRESSQSHIEGIRSRFPCCISIGAFEQLTYCRDYQHLRRTLSMSIHRECNLNLAVTFIIRYQNAESSLYVFCHPLRAADVQYCFEILMTARVNITLLPLRRDLFEALEYTHRSIYTHTQAHVQELGPKISIWRIFTESCWRPKTRADVIPYHLYKTSCHQV